MAVLKRKRTRVKVEWVACQLMPHYFLHHYAHVYDATSREWLPFRLWKAQLSSLDVIDAEQLTIVLKARQLGLTWLALGYILWLMMFWPSATALLFSKREEEAIYLLSEERLRGMYRRLPGWLKKRCPVASQPDGARAWGLANGSVVRAFPSNAGDSYTATIALVDEADLIPDLDTLLGRVKPTIDAGGKLILLSRADKSKPDSPFKRIYRAARAGQTSWRAIFLPWRAHPGRDDAWYESQRADIFARTGSLDDLHAQYPADDIQALSPRTLDKRLPSEWLQAVYREQAPLRAIGAPSIPGLVVYREPEHGHSYVIGADPAEGNPNSDASSAIVLDCETGEECAVASGLHEMTTFGGYIIQLAEWYQNASVMVERNNHGHTVIKHLRENGWGLPILKGADKKHGWMSSVLGKVNLYNACADAVRNGEVILHHFPTYTQLASIDGNTLRAPEGEHDDLADAAALACVGRLKARPATA